MTDQMAPEPAEEDPRRPMTEDELLVYVNRAIESAVIYEHDDLTAENQRAIEYFHGEMHDVPSEPGRSRAVSKDVSDVIGGLMPQVMRVFTSSDHVWRFEPRTPQDAEAARQADVYVNHVFLDQCDGYGVLYGAVHDGFLVRNGVIKVWWNDAPEFDVAEYHGMSEAMVQQIAAEDDVEVMEFAEAEPEAVEQTDPASGQTFQVMERRFDLKTKTKVRDGTVCCMAIPPEDFLVERGVRNLADARFLSHRERRTRSELIDEGYDRDLVMELPEYASFYDREEAIARHQDRAYDLARTDILDDAAEYVEVFESYVQLDLNGDGVTEWVKVVTAGTGGAAKLLDATEWDDEHPFVDIVPDPVPHRRLGRSIWDQVADLQRQKTVVMRQFLDNLYLHNNPTPIVNRQAVRDESAAEAITTRDGTAALIDGDPRSAVMYDAVPFVGDKALQALEYIDAVREQRTGLSKVAQGIDADVLQNQSATAVMQATSASHARVELYVRNIADGVRQLGRKLYRLIAQNQSRPDLVRLRGEFVQVDPRGWASLMNVSVNTGLGTGSRDRDAAALTTMGAWGQNMVQTFGETPVFGLPQARALGVKMAETQGIRNYEEIVGGSPEELAQWQQAQAEAAQTDPEAEKAQIEAQTKQQEMQLDAQLKQQELAQKAQMDQAERQQKAELERADIQARMEIEREKASQERETKLAQMQQEAELKRRQIEAEIDTKRYQIERELELKREQIERELELRRRQMSQDNGSSPVNVGGEAG